MSTTAQILANQQAILQWMSNYDANKRKYDDFDVLSEFTEDTVFPVSRSGVYKKTTLSQILLQIQPSDLTGYYRKEIFEILEDTFSITLSSSPTNIEVFLDRVPQIEGVDYTFSNNIITFVEEVETDSFVVVSEFFSDTYSTKEILDFEEGDTAFIIPGAPENIEVYLNRTVLIEGVDYTYLSSQLTLTEEVVSGDFLIIRKHF